MVKKSLAKIAAALITCTVTVYALPGKAPSDTAKTSVSTGKYTGKTPKYIFMFIGDGMSYPQIQATADYYSALAGANNNGILEANQKLNFMNFPSVGSAVTYDSTSFCPDSASIVASLSEL